MSIPDRHQETTLNRGLHTHCIERQGEQPPLVLLHGWGCDSTIWGEFLEQLQTLFPDRSIVLVDLPAFGGSPGLREVSAGKVLQLLADSLPQQSVLIGWSLGGMLATAYAARWPERVAALVCFGSNASYVQREGWSEAVPAPVLEQFREFLEQDEEKCLKRFRANQVRDDQHERTLLRRITRRETKPNSDWQAMLGLLEDIDNRQALASLSVDGLYVFGERDALVPGSVAEKIANLGQRVETRVLPGVSHVIHLSEPQLSAQIVRDFLAREAATAAGMAAGQRKRQGDWSARDRNERGRNARGRNERDKRKVAESFGRSAKSYDPVAYLQREVGAQLLARQKDFILSLGSGSWAVDLGCGTGYFVDAIKALVPELNLIGLDLAEGMIRFARENRASGESCRWLCGDAEQLPMADNSLDLVFSNMTVQWCENLDGLASGIYRVLKPGGRAIISTLGSETLSELRTAWRSADGATHVNRFETPEIWHDAFARQPFSAINLSSEIRVTEYTDVLELSRELKALGAHNVNVGRSRGLTGKQRMRQFAEGYEPFRNTANGQLPATWQVITIELFKHG